MKTIIFGHSFAFFHDNEQQVLSLHGLSHAFYHKCWDKAKRSSFENKTFKARPTCLDLNRCCNSKVIEGNLECLSKLLKINSRQELDMF
jgi:hypothetical protein